MRSRLPGSRGLWETGRFLAHSDPGLHARMSMTLTGGQGSGREPVTGLGKLLLFSSPRLVINFSK